MWGVGGIFWFSNRGRCGEAAKVVARCGGSKVGGRAFTRGRAEAELVDNLLSYLSRGTEVAVDQDVRLSVERFTFRKERADFAEGIRIIQERAMGLFADAIVNPFGRGPKTDDQSV